MTYIPDNYTAQGRLGDEYLSDEEYEQAMSSRNMLGRVLGVMILFCLVGALFYCVGMV